MGFFTNMFSIINTLNSLFRNPIILIITIPTIFVVFWFREGNILGTGESGLPFYDFNIQYNINKNAWAYYALGHPINIGSAASPTYWFIAQLQNIGIRGFILQASFFWFVLVSSGISIYFLTKILFPNLTYRFLILAVFFYWFNPLSMVNVWNRFLNNFFSFYTLLPITLLFFLKGLETKRYYYSFLIGLVSALLAYALTSVAFNLLLWLVLFYTAIFYLFIQKKIKDRFFTLSFLLLSLIFWCLTNAWWISQTFSYVFSGSFSAVQQTSFSPWNNQQIFSELSRRLGNLTYILKLQHASFFSMTSNIQWVSLYIFPPIAYFSFILPLIIFVPLAVARKTSSVLFLSGLMILGVFLAKGNNPPFGELLNFTFLKIGFLQTLRNAFEKFGFILSLAGAPLFSFGIYILVERMRKWQRYIYATSLFWLIVIFGFPFWTGLVFTGGDFPANIPQKGYQVKVPDYYKEASSWLSSQSGNFRLLTFPIDGEGITYNWERGYTGVELSNQLLPATSVSFQTNIPFYEDITGELEKSLMTKGDFTKITDILNAKYIMFRNDIDWSIRGMRDPHNIFKKLKENKQFNIVKNFGALTFWENPNFVDKKIYLVNNAISVSPQANVSDVQFLTNNTALLGDNVQLKGTMISQQILHPLVRFSLASNLNQISRTEQDIFPHIKYSPGDKIYRAVLYKEQLELSTIPSVSAKIDYGIKLLGKRLVEARSEADLDNDKNVLIAIIGYENLLKILRSSFSEYSYIKLDFDKQLLKQEDFYSIFNEHKKILASLIDRFSTNRSVVEKLRNTQKLLDSTLINMKIQPTFGFKEGSGLPIKNRVAYKFDVKSPGEYELLWGNRLIDTYYQQVVTPGQKENTGSSALLQIDDQLVTTKVSYNKSEAKSFGKIYFDPGIHEISLNADIGVNLVGAPSEINLKVQHGIAQEIFPIKNYDPFASYTISFDYFIKTGSGVEVSVLANNANVDLGKVNPDFLKVLGLDNYDFGEKHFSTGFRLNKGADSANLVFTVKPWNDCESIFFTKGKDRCKDESFRYPYDRTTEVIIKNISVTRNFVDEPILIKSNQLSSIAHPALEFKKMDNTKYIVRVIDVKRPYILILSELFDPGWKIFTSEGADLKSKHFLVNAYANGWEIDKQGSYELVIKFRPQDLLGPATKLSLFASVLSILIIVWGVRKKYVNDN